MLHKADFTPEADTGADANLNDMAELATSLGFEVVDVAGFLDLVDAQSQEQLAALSRLQTASGGISDAHDRAQVALEGVTASADEMTRVVSRSVGDLEKATARTRDVASWMQGMEGRMTAAETTLAAILKDNGRIASIARQVNILAINAKIEAARAGTAGQGFAVVAQAINALSQKTADAAREINGTIDGMAAWLLELKDEAKTISKASSAALEDTARTDTALSDIADHVTRTRESMDVIRDRGDQVRRAIMAFGPEFTEMERAVGRTSGDIHHARDRVNALIDRAERILQGTVAMGGETDDQQFITIASDAATRIIAAVEDALERGDITREALFDQRYSTIAGTSPQQVMAPFTLFMDQVLPPVQEQALTLDERIVFCALVDRNGYLPTHNLKFSKPQSDDPIWNAAHCRNRRIFDDRVGLKAGRNTAPFLLQTYRRDMGGGDFRMMKDLSVPVIFAGRHWGGLRLAYKIQ